VSRRGGPSSGILRRHQLRPRRLTPLELRALVVLDRLPMDVPTLAMALRVSERTAWNLAAALLELGRVHLRDGLLHPGAS